jgi:hypothetical protein
MARRSRRVISMSSFSMLAPFWPGFSDSHSSSIIEELTERSTQADEISPFAGKLRPDSGKNGTYDARNQGEIFLLFTPETRRVVPSVYTNSAEQSAWRVRFEP